MIAPETFRPSLESVLAHIERGAVARDQNGGNLAQEIGWLHEAGALVEALPASLTGVSTWSDDPVAIFQLLRTIGRASLPVGRLFEGHINAAQLVGLYGTPELRERCVGSVRAGELLGVWGADGAEALQAEPTPTGFRLSGSKIFCSGLRLVGMAVVSASLSQRTVLFAVDAGDPERSDHGQWRVSGMRATQSGGYDFDGVELAPDALLGRPDDYFVEPYFLGGMYRMCAVQVGGLDALMKALITSLRRKGKAKNPLGQHRVGSVASLRLMAAAITEHLARRVAEGADPSEVSREAILTREGVERCIMQALELVERSLGTDVHREETRVSTIRRDLSFYIRQAATDERLAMVGCWHLLEDDAHV